MLDSPGGGGVVLLGNNTYTGGTFICSCGTLQIGDATHTASIVGAVANDGLLNIVNANTSGITSITNDRDFGAFFAGLTTFRNATSAGTMTITNLHSGETDFVDSSSAGSARIINNDGNTVFLDASTAGNANISNHDGTTAFGTFGGTDTSTAGHATIINDDGGVVFLAMTNAGTATITNINGGGIIFGDQASAASATITNSNGGFTSFGQPGFTDTPTAGNAVIVNNSGGETDFNAFSTAGNATITTNSGGATLFYDNSTGGTAQFITNGTGFVDFSGSIGPNSDGRVTAGSIAGSGTYYIGAGNTLVVGGNNLSTTVSGVIADYNPAPPCGCAAIPGIGSLEKVGAGTLILSGTPIPAPRP